MLIAGRNVPLPESPQGKFWAWVVGIVVGTAAVLLGLDATFARKAEAVNKMEVDHMIVAATSATAASVNLNTEYLIDQQSKRSIDAQLYSLEQIPVAALRPEQRALMQRLARDREELVRLWIQRGRPLR